MDYSWWESGPITIGAFDGAFLLGGQGKLGMETMFCCLCFFGLPSRNAFYVSVAGLYTFEWRKAIKNVDIGW